MPVNKKIDERNKNIKIYINGSFFNREDAKISVFDSGFLLGDGIWEGIRLINNEWMFLDQHLDRLFEGCKAVDININLSKDSNLFLCENIVFGRTSMKEELKSGFFSDFWKIYYDNKLIHSEALNTNNFNKEVLKNKSILNKNCAIATIILVGKKFLNIGDELSKFMTKNNYTISEYSAWDEKLIIRCISKDSYNLKFAINKILSYFFENSQIPRIWNI